MTNENKGMVEATTINKGGAPKGNNNKHKNRPWADAIDRAVKQSDGKRLRSIAEALLNKAEDGDIQAIKELGDRIDGKVAQTIQGSGEQGEILTSLTVEFVRNE